ncbi:hypothetical protein ACTD5D_36305 [Nocardia takedensis]|uniref:hypothetical protein n=1 Tax=Nocardia takedensis TaxID=259390 RepID=UPI00031CF76F|nr:hypothetical protein [Nocardia takedensis]
MLSQAPLQDTRFEVLAAAAFGGRPGTAAAELPAPADGVDGWLSAVALAGQGYYAAARARLRRVRRLSADPVLLSLVASTEGSLLRQSGRHADAAVADGRAFALIASRASAAAGAHVSSAQPVALEMFDKPTSVTPSVFAGLADPGAALCDALTGLAADALGRGRTDLADRLLRRAGGPAASRPRALIRLHWVSAENALAAGDPRRARPHAETALALARACPSRRHEVKSLLLTAAAAAADGDLDTARATADAVAARCAEHDLFPLAWAGAMLRSGLGDAAAASDAAAFGAVIARRGGHFRLG